MTVKPELRARTLHGPELLPPHATIVPLTVWLKADPVNPIDRRMTISPASQIPTFVNLLYELPYVKNIYGNAVLQSGNAYKDETVSGTIWPFLIRIVRADLAPAPLIPQPHAQRAEVGQDLPFIIAVNITAKHVLGIHAAQLTPGAGVP